MVICNSHAYTRVKNSLLAKPSAYDEDTFMLRDSYYKFYVSYDYEYSPLVTDFGAVNMHGGGLEGDVFSFSAGAGLWAQTSNRMGFDVNVEVSYKQLKSGLQNFKFDPLYNGVQLIKAHYSAERYYISLPVGFNYQWGKRWRVGFGGFLAPKVCVENTVKGYEYLSNGTERNAPYGYDGDVKLNMELRFSIIAEIPVNKSKIRLIPVYRINMFNESKGKHYPKSASLGCCIELLL